MVVSVRIDSCAETWSELPLTYSITSSSKIFSAGQTQLSVIGIIVKPIFSPLKLVKWLTKQFLDKICQSIN